MARITVVNDYPDFLDTMYSILDGLEGHDVAGFDGEETSLEDLVGSRPDLLIIDLRLASDRMHGWDLVLLARADDRLRDVPLIVCSADVATLREREAEFRLAGQVYPLAKPFGLDDIVAVVNRALDEADAESEAAS